MSRKEDAQTSPINSQALLKSRISSPNLTHSKEDMKTESIPRYSTFIYQFQAVNKPDTLKDIFSSRFINNEADPQKRGLNSNHHLKQEITHSETFLKFFILKTQHYKGQERGFWLLNAFYFNLTDTLMMVTPSKSPFSEELTNGQRVNLISQLDFYRLSFRLSIR